MSEANLCKASSDKLLPAYLFPLVVSVAIYSWLGAAYRVRLNLLIISHRETLLSAQVSIGSNIPSASRSVILGSPMSECSLQNFLLSLSSSLGGLGIEISRIFIPHGLPT
jgi:hypothetical protein